MSNCPTILTYSKVEARKMLEKEYNRIRKTVSFDKNLRLVITAHDPSEQHIADMFSLLIDHMVQPEIEDA